MKERKNINNTLSNASFKPQYRARLLKAKSVVVGSSLTLLCLQPTKVVKQTYKHRFSLREMWKHRAKPQHDFKVWLKDWIDQGRLKDVNLES